MNRKTRDLLEDLDTLIPEDFSSTNTALVNRMSELLHTSDESRRTLHFSLLLEAMGPGDGPSVAAMFGQLKREGLEFHQEANFFAQRWGELDPDAALAFIVEEDGRFERGGILLDRVISGWASRDPAAVAEWLAEQPEGSLKDAAIEGAATGWARSGDSQGVTGFVVGLPEGSAQSRAAATVFWQLLYQDGLDAATAWYETLPEIPPGIRAAVLPHLTTRKLESGDPGAQAWLERQYGQPAPPAGE